MIAFDIPQVFNFLTKHGFVYTLRHAGRTTGIIVATHHHICACYVVVMRIRADIPDDLHKYLVHSSFDTVDEWLRAASPTARTLYLVKIK